MGYRFVIEIFNLIKYYQIKYKPIKLPKATQTSAFDWLCLI